MRYANSISLITLVTSVMKISGSLTPGRSQKLSAARAIKEFRGNFRDGTETSRPWPRNAVVKSIFACLRDSQHQRCIVESLGKVPRDPLRLSSKCNIIPAEYSGLSRNRRSVGRIAVPPVSDVLELPRWCTYMTGGKKNNRRLAIAYQWPLHRTNV